VNRLLARFGVRQREHVSVARDFSFSGINSIALVLLLSTALVLRRSLGPYLTGIWTGLELLPAYVGTYGHFGVLTAAERDLPYLLGARRDADFDRHKHTIFWLTHALGLVLCLGLVAAAFAMRPRVEPQTFTGMLLYAPILWAQLVSTYYVVLYRARKRFGELSVRQGGANVFKAALLVAGGFAFGLYGVLIVELVAALTIAGILHAGLHERFEPVFDLAVVPPLVMAGVPMVAGAVAFEVMRGADQTVILATLGPTMLGVYSLTAIVCQGLFYIPNVLSMVMYPRFQERFAQTSSPHSLRKFVELPLHVLADSLLALNGALFVALPPVIAWLYPQFTGTIPPLRVMLIGTYFLCLTPPAGQLLLTLRKQVRALVVGVPAMALAIGAAYVGARWGLTGVAAGISIVFFLEFAAINAYALSHFEQAGPIARALGGIAVTAALFFAAAAAVQRLVPAGPWPIALVGGWRLAVMVALGGPLLVRAGRRIRALGQAESVDTAAAGD
jgi:O-antigen/teichoic acid export membrane protein